MGLGVWWLKGITGIVFCIAFRCGGRVVLSVLWLGEIEAEGAR